MKQVLPPAEKTLKAYYDKLTNELHSFEEWMSLDLQTNNKRTSVNVAVCSLWDPSSFWTLPQLRSFTIMHCLINQMPAGSVLFSTSEKMKTWITATSEF